MANIIPFSFRGALFEANHNFKASGGNTFKLACIHSGSNPYSTASTVYSGTAEVSSGGTGYNYAVKTFN